MLYFEGDFMTRTEFGIIDDFDPNITYDKYEPEKYNCVVIDDDKYINDWWNELLLIRTYNMSVKQPQMALSRWGITLLPPDSLPEFLKIVKHDKRVAEDENLQRLCGIISIAIDEGKYMIHFGI